MENIPSEKQTLGLCLIAKDEEKNIADCIESVRKIVDEIVVVDTGSNDDTVPIAESLGAAVYQYPWDDNFSNARNFAIRHAKSEWLLLLDADEQVDQSGLDTIVTFINTTEMDGAYFRVRNYIGSYSPQDFTMHNALRLLRNNGKYQYRGAIHEQIVCDNLDYVTRFETLSVILNHYGYLDNEVAEKQKRERNMPILERELKENPDDVFVLYYLGNEYLALNQVKQALEYYLKSYQNAKKYHMVFAHLYLKMMTSMEVLGQSKESLDLIKEALGAFPLCTDFEFVRAVVFFRTRRYTLAIKSLNRCLEMGVPPAPLEFLEGCGTYRAAYMLGDIYAIMEDYEASLKWYQATLRYNPNYYTALYNVGFTLNKLIPDKDKVCAELFSCFSDPNDTANVVTASDILIKEGLYSQALTKLNAITDAGDYLPETDFFHALALFYINDFQAAIPLFEAACAEGAVQKEGRPALRPSIAQYLLVAGMLQKDSAVLNRGLELSGLYCTPKAQAACRLLYAVYADLPQEDPHFEDGGEKELETILTIFEIVLKQDRPELLRKLFGALTFIDSKSALSRLAKLYWDSGDRELAARLIVHSVRDLDYLDAFGSEVLFKQFIP
jgi:glycosyltransferase involved in cell wall biosynthesis